MKTRYSQSYLLLFAQLLVFFFVSSLTITSSNTFADEISEDNIKNFVYNASVSFGSPIDDSVFERQNYLNWYNAISSIINTKDFFLYANWGTQSSDVNVDLQITLQTFTNFNQDWSTNLNTGLFYIRGQYQGAQNFRYNISSDTYTYRADYDSTASPKGIWYSSRNIYNFLNTSQLLYSGPHAEPSDIFEGPYSSSLGLYFLNKLSDFTVDVWSFEDIPLYKFSGEEDFYFGQLFYPLGSNVYETNSNFFFRWGDWQFRTLPDSATYLDYVGSDDKGSLYDVYLDKNYLYDNTIYSLVWTDTTTDPYTLAYANFYLGDKNTVIVDGVIDPLKTFSGDYDDKYNYENDPNQNFWKDTYNRFMTPSGEVLRGTITSLMSDLDFYTSGEESGELMMALVGLDVISNDFGDFIISWDDFSPNLTIKGQSVSSSGPFIPAGQINFSQMERNNETFHDIMQYTRAILSFSVITLFFGNLWHTLLITLGISTQIYEKNEQAKEKLSRQAERDQRRQEREDRQRYQQWLYEHRR